MSRDERRFHWAMFATDVPIAHQRCEATADLMDHLRSEGLVLDQAPTVTVRHGVPPVMTLTYRAHHASAREAQLLDHNDKENR